MGQGYGGGRIRAYERMSQRDLINVLRKQKVTEDRDICTIVDEEILDRINNGLNNEPVLSDNTFNISVNQSQIVASKKTKQNKW